MPGRFVQNATFSCYGTRRLRRILKFIQCTQCIVLYHILGLYIPHMHRAKHALHERFLSVPSTVARNTTVQLVSNSSRSESGWQCRMSWRVCKHSGNMHSQALCPALLLRQALLQRAAAEECTVLYFAHAQSQLLVVRPNSHTMIAQVRPCGAYHVTKPHRLPRLFVWLPRPRLPKCFFLIALLCSA